MLTLPNTPAREKEISDIVEFVRARLMSGDFTEVILDQEIASEPSDDGFERYSLTGGFTLTCRPRTERGSSQ